MKSRGKRGKKSGSKKRQLAKKKKTTTEISSKPSKKNKINRRKAKSPRKAEPMSDPLTQKARKRRRDWDQIRNLRQTTRFQSLKPVK